MTLLGIEFKLFKGRSTRRILRDLSLMESRNISAILFRIFYVGLYRTYPESTTKKSIMFHVFLM